MKDIIVRGDCAIGFLEDVVKFEWNNQMKDKKTYYYTFRFLNAGSLASSMQLRGDPYRKIFNEKRLHMGESGIMEQMFLQRKPLKVAESEPLAPLKLGHFYMTLFGICICLVTCAIVFFVETYNKMFIYIKALFAK